MMYVRYALPLIGKSVIDKRGLYVRNHFVYFKNNWNYSADSAGIGSLLSFVLYCLYQYAIKQMAFTKSHTK